MGKIVAKSVILIVPILFVIGCLRMYFSLGNASFLPTDLSYYWNQFMRLDISQGALKYANFILDWLLGLFDFSRFSDLEWWEMVANVIGNLALLSVAGLPALVAIVVLLLFIPLSFLGWFFGIMFGFTEVGNPANVGSAIGNVLLSLPLSAPVGV